MEIRRYFQAPGGVFASSSSSFASSPGTAGLAGRVPLSASSSASASLRHDTFQWNDRDCNATNFFLCERPQTVDMLASRASSSYDTSSLITASDSTATDERQSSSQPLVVHWPGIASACNQTVRLTRSRQRAHVSSPGNPYDYPDNVNCFTVIEAPDGYSVVLEFEEFVLEAEPECTYDYLEIVDPFSKAAGAASTAESTEQQQQSAATAAASHWQRTNDVFPEESAHGTLRSLYMKYLTHQQRRLERSLPIYHAPIVGNSTDNDTNGTNPSNSTAYEQFMHAYASLQRRRPPAAGIAVLRIPAHSSADAAADFTANKQQPHRVCGDWNAKLKLLRYTSVGRLLGLRFSSDYSHHRSGFKARVVLKNGK